MGQLLAHTPIPPSGPCTPARANIFWHTIGTVDEKTGMVSLNGLL